MSDYLGEDYPHCYHLHGPTGVKYATKQLQKALATGEYHYIIRADIKGYYSSILHHKLVNDIKQTFDDPKVHHMLSEVITNPIETPWGCKNPHRGIALRGPLSQLFSAIYLTPLDQAFDNADVRYLRFQDDIVILCKSKRQLNRSRRKMMNVLQERRLTLSRKKSRIGMIKDGFHFLGIHYAPTQSEHNTTLEQDNIANKSPKLKGGVH